jgi:hypothetical protein
MEERLARILAGVERLRQLDPPFATFGASAHHFRFGPTLSPEELGQLEDRYGVRLPEEYRQFLLHIVNGGGGPGYGLSRFGWLDSPDDVREAKPTGRMITVATGPHLTAECPEMAYPDGTIADNFDLAFYYGMIVLTHDHSGLKATFPLTEPLRIPDDAERKERETDDLTDWPDPFADEEDEEGDEEAEGYPDRGCFRLGTYGCGIDPVLIVTGPFAGHVWVDDRWNNYGFVPFEDYSPDDTMHGGEIAKPGPYTFLDWYEDWLLLAIEMANRS